MNLKNKNRIRLIKHRLQKTEAWFLHPELTIKCTCITCGLIRPLRHMSPEPNTQFYRCKVQKFCKTTRVRKHKSRLSGLQDMML